MTEETYNIEAGNYTECNAGNESSCCNSAIDTCYTSTWSIRRKFVIVHELGHLIARHGAPELLSLNYGYDGNGETVTSACDEDGDFDDGSHAPLELEWVGAALGEGFCDFYAADVWNDHDEYDCWAAWFGTGLSCESGTTAYPEKWVNGHTCRNPDDPQSGERFDWMRILWDTHTNAASGNPTFTYMLGTWLDGAGAWGSTNAFTVIDARAESLGTQLDTNWAAAVSYNAAYYCPPSGQCR